METTDDLEKRIEELMQVHGLHNIMCSIIRCIQDNDSSPKSSVINAFKEALKKYDSRYENE